MEYTILFISLIIALVWMILYCVYLKNRIRDVNIYMSKISAEQVETRRLLRSLGKINGFDLPCTLQWEKLDVKKQ